MKLYFIYLLFVSLIFIDKINTELIIFSLKDSNTKANSSFDFMSTLYSKELYTNLTLGSPNPKIIPTVISQDEVAFSINSKYYNIKESSNYEEIHIYQRSFTWENINNGVLFQDSLWVNSTNETNNDKIEEKKFRAKFIYVENQTNNYIGLNFPDLYEHNVISIFKTLKDNKLIENYQWCPIIKQKNLNNEYKDWLNIGGELIFGGNCSDFLPKQFEKKFITEYEMYSHGPYVEYSIKFSNLYLGDDEVKNDLYYKQAFFELKFLTIGSLEYKNKMENLFFNDYLHKNICYAENMNMYRDISFYYCNKTKEFDIKKFPSLCMKEKEKSNKTFCFNYNDLFIEDPNNKNIIYFLIVFKKYNPSDDSSKYFHFGLQFLEKYQLSFDPKNKKIYYYGKDEQSKQNEERKSSSSSYLVQYILIIIFLSIILFVLGMICQKQISKLPRKKKANELLDDNYEYEQKNIN